MASAGGTRVVRVVVFEFWERLAFRIETAENANACLVWQVSDTGFESSRLHWLTFKTLLAGQRISE
jgi:hypothetical protein